MASPRLQRYSLDTGQLRRDTLVSSSLQFINLAVAECGWLVLSSAKRQKPGAQNTDRSKDVMKSFMVFDKILLDFLYHFEVRRSVFGSNITDADCSDALIVMDQNNFIQIFSMDHVLQNSQHEKTTQQSNFSVNLHLTKKPQILFHYKSHQNYLELNMKPWLFISSSAEKTFSVQEIVGGNKVNGGDFSPVNEDISTSEMLHFAPDDSGRVVRHGAFGFTIFNVEESEDRTHRLETWFALKTETESIFKVDTAAPRRRGGRIRKLVQYCDNTSVNITEYDYEVRKVEL